MKKSDIKNLPPYFDKYINLNEDIALKDAFEKSIRQIDELDLELWDKIGLKVYAENKWSIHKIIQHITDWERIWCYRILLFVRQEGSIPVPHDEEIMGKFGNADVQSLELLIDELRAVRLATKAMFNSFDDALLQVICKTTTSEMSVLAMGFTIIGHQLHHFNIIKERYEPLLG